MSRFRTNENYSKGAIASNASFVGAWFWIEDANSIGLIATIPAGSGSPTASYTMEVSDDPDANKKTDAQLLQPPTAVTFTAAQIAAFPAGADVAQNFLYQFDPCPRAKWARFSYIRTGGGSATLNQRLAVSLRGI